MKTEWLKAEWMKAECIGLKNLGVGTLIKINFTGQGSNGALIAGECHLFIIYNLITQQASPCLLAAVAVRS